jgi:hypothetical protein
MSTSSAECYARSAEHMTQDLTLRPVDNMSISHGAKPDERHERLLTMPAGIQ